MRDVRSLRCPSTSPVRTPVESTGRASNSPTLRPLTGVHALALPKRPSDGPARRGRRTRALRCCSAGACTSACAHRTLRTGRFWHRRVGDERLVRVDHPGLGRDRWPVVHGSRRHDGSAVAHPERAGLLPARHGRTMGAVHVPQRTGALALRPPNADRRSVPLRRLPDRGSHVGRCDRVALALGLPVGAVQWLARLQPAARVGLRPRSRGHGKLVCAVRRAGSESRLGNALIWPGPLSVQPGPVTGASPYSNEIALLLEGCAGHPAISLFASGAHSGTTQLVASRQAVVWWTGGRQVVGIAIRSFMRFTLALPAVPRDSPPPPGGLGTAVWRGPSIRLTSSHLYYLDADHRLWAARLALPTEHVALVGRRSRSHRIQSNVSRPGSVSLHVR